MKRNIFLLAFLLITALVSAQNRSKNLSVTESKHDFEQTYARLVQKLEELQLPVFADFNHYENAQGVGLAMGKSRVIVFGNPKVGTLLMQENPAIALDLPMKIAVIEDKNQKIQLIFTNTTELAKKYRIKNKSVIEKMQSLLQNIVNFAAN